MSDRDGRCESCGTTGAALRSIKLTSGDRSLLCESCFQQALGDNRVHPGDARVEAGGGSR